MTKIKSPIRNPQSTMIWPILATLTIFVYFFGLTIPLLGPDESRYAQVAREMFDRGDWVTPTLGGFNWFEKPALLYWLQIAAYKLFGVNEFAARCGSALFGLGTVVTLWILGRHAVSQFQTSSNPDRTARNEFAKWLALIAASTLGILVFSRGASFDIVITFPLTAAMVSFYVYDRSRKAVPLVLFYAFVGVSLLAKGLIGIVFPFAIVGLFFLMSRRLPTRTFVFSLFWGTLLACFIASTWYLPMYQRHGFEFIDEFFIQHHFQRFTSNKYQHPQPFYFFFWVLPLMTVPWLPFFFAAIWSHAKRAFQSNVMEKQGSPTSAIRDPRSPASLLLFSAAWLLVPLLFFSFSGSKLPGYILPAVPAAIVLTAVFIYDRLINNRTLRNVTLSISVLTFSAVILLLIFAVPKFADADSVKSLIVAANARGYSQEHVLTLHTISHNAEFYAANRLVRTVEGKQKRLHGPIEVVEEIRRIGASRSLVLVPVEYVDQTTSSRLFDSEWIRDNGELAVLLVTLK